MSGWYELLKADICHYDTALCWKSVNLNISNHKIAIMSYCTVMFNVEDFAVHLKPLKQFKICTETHAFYTETLPY